MLLKQVFKTSAGAVRRCEFENAHTKVYHYRVVRFYKGKPDTRADYSWPMAADYTWRLERTTLGEEYWGWL